MENKYQKSRRKKDFKIPKIMEEKEGFNSQKKGDSEGEKIL